MSSAPVSRRDRPAKIPLTRELVVRTGLTVLDRDGIDALTMRRVGQELDTGAASLYVYVANRDDLLTAMLDEALVDVWRAVTVPGSWQQRLVALVEATIAAMSRHERLAFVALGAVPSGRNALLIMDRMIALLKEGGLDDATVSFAVDLLYLHCTAVGAETSAYVDRGASEEATVAAATQHFAGLPAAEYPMITAMGSQLFMGSGDQRARWAVQVLLNGILKTPATSAG